MTRPTGLFAFCGELQQLDVDDHAVELFDGGDLRRAVTPMRSTLGASAGGNSMPSGMSIHCWMRSSCGTTYVPRRPMWNSPTTVGMGALQDLDDFAVGAAVGFDARDAHHDAVAVHGAARRNRAG